MIGIIVAGGDVEALGFSIGEDEAISRAQRMFARHRMTMYESELFYWEDIQRHVRRALDGERERPTVPNALAFLRWLASFDLSRYATAFVRRHAPEQFVKGLLDRNPRAFEFVKKFVERRGWRGY